MKVFKTPGVTQTDIEGWLEEAVLLSKIGHPNIVRVFDANTIDTRDGALGFFTMEYVAGGSLERLWQSYGNQFVPVREAVEILVQACRGLLVAHSEKPPIVHRDLKPQNILVGYDGQGVRIRLSDFGLAKRVNPLSLLASTKGTVAFKAPEALADVGKDSPAADVWALGATLYLLLTDRLPYAPLKPDELASLSRFERPLVPPSRLNYLVDGAIDSILVQALQPDPLSRFPNAGKFLSALETWGGGEDMAMKQKSPPQGSDESKGALGVHTRASEAEARRKALKARELAKRASKLGEAADLLEEAINAWPELKEEYVYELSLWRRGVMM
jgi:serine/threonine-protein kinase